MRKTNLQLRSEIDAYLSRHRSGRSTRGSARGRRPSRDACTYHALGQEGDPWPAWLADLKQAAGAYVIRDSATRRALYAGSAKNNLYATITRHFQQWRRQKKWWKGQYGAGHDPGLVYPRGRCEVAAWITTEADRLQKETNLIEYWKPRDNLVQHPDGESEEAPF